MDGKKSSKSFKSKEVSENYAESSQQSTNEIETSSTIVSRTETYYSSTVEEKTDTSSVGLEETLQSIFIDEGLSQEIDNRLKDAKEQTKKFKINLDFVSQLFEKIEKDCVVLKDSNKTLHRKVKLIETIKEKFHEVETELVVSKTRMESMIEEKSNLLRQIQSLKKQIEENQDPKIIKQQMVKIAEMESIISKLRVEIQTKTDSISELESVKKNYNVMIKEFKMSLKESMIRGLQLINEKDFDVDQASILDICNHLKNIVQTFESINENSKTVIVNLNHEAEEKNLEVCNLKRELDFMKKQNEEKEAKESQMMNTIEQANDEIIKLLQVIDEYSQENQKLRELELYKTKSLELIEELAEKNKLLSNLENSIREFTKNKITMEQKIYTLEKTVESTQNDLVQEKKQLLAWKEKVEQLKQCKSLLDNELVDKKEFTIHREELNTKIETTEIFQTSTTILEETQSSSEQYLQKVPEDSIDNQRKLVDQMSQMENSLRNDLTQVKRNLSDSEKQLADEMKYNQTLEGEVKSLTIQNSLLEKYLKLMKTESVAVQKEFIQTNEKIVMLERNIKLLTENEITMKNEISTLGETIASNQSDLALKQKEVDDLTNMINTEKQLDDEKKDIRKLQDKVNKLITQNSSLEKDLELISIESFTLNKELNEKTEMIRTMKYNIEVFTANEITMKNEISTLEETIASNQNDLVLKNKEVNDLKAKIRELRGCKSSLENELETYVKEITTYQQDLKIKNETIATLQTNINILVNTKTAIEQDLIIVTENSVVTEEELKEEIEALKAQICRMNNSLGAELTQVNRNLSNTEKMLDEEMKNTQNLEDKVHNLINQNSYCEKDLEMISTESVRLNKQLNEKTEIIRTMRHNIEVFTANENTMKNEIITLEKTIASNQNDLVLKQKEVDDLKNKIQELRGCESSLENELETYVKKITTYQQDLKVKIETIGILKTSIMILEETKMSIEKELETITETSYVTEEELKEEIERLKAQIFRMNNSQEVKLTQVKRNLSNAEKQEDDEKKDIRNLQDKVNNLIIQNQDDLALKQEEVDDLKAKHAQLCRINDSLKTELKQVKQNLLDTEKQLDDEKRNTSCLQSGMEAVVTVKTETTTERTTWEKNNKSWNENRVSADENLTSFVENSNRLQRELSQAKILVDELKMTIENLKGNKFGVENKLASSEKAVSTLQEDMRVKIQMIETLQAIVKSYEENKSSLKSNLDIMKRNLFEIKTSLMNKVEIIASLEKNTTELKNKNSSLECKLNEFELISEQLIILRDEVSEKNKTIETLTADIENLNHSIFSSDPSKSQNIKQLQIKIVDLERTNLSLEAEIGSLNIKLLESEKKFAEKNKADFNLHQEQIAMLNKFLDEKRKIISDLKEYNDSLEIEIITVQKNFDEVQTNFNIEAEKIKALEAYIDEIEAENTALNKDFNSIKKESADVHKKLEEKTQENKTLENTIKELELIRISLKNDLKSAQEVLIRSEEKLASNESELARFRQTIADLQDQLLKGEDEKRNLVSKVGTVLKELESMSKIHKIITGQVEEEKVEICKLNEEIVNLRKLKSESNKGCRCQEYFSMLSQMSKDIEAKIRENQDLVSKNYTLLQEKEVLTFEKEDTIEGMKSMIHSLEKRLSREQNTTQNLHDEIKLMEQDIQISKAESEALRKNKLALQEGYNKTLSLLQNEELQSNAAYEAHLFATIGNNEIIAELKKMIGDMEKKILELLGFFVIDQADLTSYDSSRMDLLHECNKCNENLDEIVSQVKKIIRDKSWFEIELNLVLERNEEIEKNMEGLKREIEQLRNSQPVRPPATSKQVYEREGQTIIYSDTNVLRNNSYVEKAIISQNYVQEMDNHFNEGLQKCKSTMDELSSQPSRTFDGFSVGIREPDDIINHMRNMRQQPQLWMPRLNESLFTMRGNNEDGIKEETTTTRCFMDT